MHMPEFKDQLEDNGFCVADNVLDKDTLRKLQAKYDRKALMRISSEGESESGIFSRLDYTDILIAKLLCWPKTVSILKSMGFSDPKLHSFYLSTKQPNAEGLSWHTDLFYDFEDSFPAELFLIYYLDSTNPENGCLRVIPGSHKWNHTKRHDFPEDNKHNQGEVDVPIKAGSLFIGDRRLLHSTHPNRTDSWRSCITISYAPCFDKLPEPIQALIAKNPCLPKEGELRALDKDLISLIPLYKGKASSIV